MTYLHRLPTWLAITLLAVSMAAVISGAEIMFDIQDFEPG